MAEVKSPECCTCGARSLKMHKLKLQSGFYAHPYTGPGKHRLVDERKGK